MDQRIGRKSSDNGIELTGVRYNIFNAGSMGDVYGLDQLYYFDRRNVLYLLEHNELFEQENIKISERYSQVEISPDIPLELFRFAEKDYQQVESFK